MKHGNHFTTPDWSLVKSAIWGAFSLATITGIVFIAGHLWMHGRKGDFLPDFLFGCQLIVCVPAVLVAELLGFYDAPADSFLSSKAFVVIVNGLLGPVIFPVFRLFWRYIVKGNNDNQN